MANLPPFPIPKRGSENSDSWKAIDGGTADTAAPAPDTKGIATLGAKYLHITTKNAAGSADITIRGRYQGGEWCILTWIGTSGVISQGTDPQIIEPALLQGIPEVHVQLTNVAGGASVDVRLFGSNIS